jgi:hypothetical protein
MVDVLVRELIFFEEPREGPLHMSDRTLKSELRRALYAYLGVGDRAPKAH